MLDGWYCRSMANAASNDERAREESKYKAQYRFLKRKLKHLVYENECFQDQLRTAQKRLLAVTRDRSFLLDRLLQYEKGMSTTDSEDTDSSDEELSRVENNRKQRKLDSGTTSQNSNNVSAGGGAGGGKGPSQARKKRPVASKQSKQLINMPVVQAMSLANNISSDGHMTPEEVERHLQSRQSYLELVPERAPPTVPTEMFSNEPSLDSFVYFSESNDIGEQETSPSNMEEELSVDMIND